MRQSAGSAGRAGFFVAGMVSELVIFAAAVVWLSLLPSTGNGQDWEPTPGAVQYVYQRGVPHTDAQGRLLMSYDPQRSFLPRGIYHALIGTFYGRTYSLAPFKPAGFNFVHVFEKIRLGEIIPAAEEEGLQVVYHNPTMEEVAQYAGSPRLLGWYLDEEPTGRYWGQDMEGHFQEFQQRRAQIKQIDPVHPVFPLDVAAGILEPRTQWWLRWAAAGDISVHDNYTILDGTTTIADHKGIPATLKMALSATGEKLPLWLVVQAHLTRKRVQRQLQIPTPQQERCMIYTAIIHGATGIWVFAYDSFVMRNALSMGVSPDPVEDTGGAKEERYLATEENIRQSRELWQALTRINGELETLKPVIFSPTAPIAYSVSVQGAHASDAPIRCLLKRFEKDYYLFAANVDGQPIRAKLDFPRTIRRLDPLFDPRPPTKVEGQTLYDSFEPWGVRIYKLDFG